MRKGAGHYYGPRSLAASPGGLPIVGRQPPGILTFAKPLGWRYVENCRSRHKAMIHNPCSGLFFMKRLWCTSGQSMFLSSVVRGFISWIFIGRPVNNNVFKIWESAQICEKFYEVWKLVLMVSSNPAAIFQRTYIYMYLFFFFFLVVGGR